MSITDAAVLEGLKTEKSRAYAMREKAFYEIVPAGTDEKVGAVAPLKYQKSETAGKGEMFTVKTRYKLPNAETSVLREKAHTAVRRRR